MKKVNHFQHFQHPWVAFLGVIVAALVIYVLTDVQKGDHYVDSAQAVTESQVVHGIDQTPGSTNEISYSEALAAYHTSASRLHVQFSADCQANPKQMTLKRGTKFLLDNRDSVKHSLVVRGQNINLGPYGFAVVTARESSTITCDGKDVFKLSVQN